MRPLIWVCFTLIFPSLLASGCLPAMVATLTYESKMPRTVLVLPIDDSQFIISPKADPKKLSSRPGMNYPDMLRKGRVMLERALYQRGYDVIKYEDKKSILAREGIDEEVLFSTEPKKLASLTGAEAVLKSVLNDYSYTYENLYFIENLDMHFTLIDGKTGTVLWQSPLQKSEKTFGGLLHPLEEKITGKSINRPVMVLFWIKREGLSSLPGGSEYVKRGLLFDKELFKEALKGEFAE